MTFRTMLVVAAVALIALPGCGRSPEAGAIEDAEASLRTLTSGTLDMRLAAGALDTDSATAGFGLSGSFALPEDDALPVLDLTYTQIAGEQQDTATIQSTGQEVLVTVDGTTTAVPEEQLTGLVGSSQQTGGLPELGLHEWFINPSVDATGHTVTGELDLAAAMTGLARFTGALGATDALGGVDLEDEAAQRLREAVTRSEVTLSLTGTDRLLERLAFTAELESAADLPVELKGGRFEFELGLADHNQPVVVGTQAAD